MSYTQNHYHILNLAAPSPTARPKSAELRHAYRTALLRAHPDKKGTGTNAGEGEGRGEGAVAYTVDDVREAYRVLDDEQRRSEYDTWLARNPHMLQSAGRGAAAAEEGRSGQTLSADFILGLDVLDLSDFAEREGGDEGEWTRACRCGDQAGFRIAEADLVGAERRGDSEVLVGCGGCSLWVRVGFEVEEG